MLARSLHHWDITPRARAMIPDTSGQDTLIATPASSSQGKPRRLVWLGVAAAGAA
jgi:hypothetical protein